jgi:hypothetical protein
MKLSTLLPELESSLLDAIGVALQLGDEDDGQWLDALLTSEQDDNKRKLFKILKKWLQDLKPVSWKRLMDVLESHIRIDTKILKEQIFEGQQLI